MIKRKNLHVEFTRFSSWTINWATSKSTIKILTRRSWIVLLECLYRWDLTDIYSPGIAYSIKVNSFTKEQTPASFVLLFLNSSFVTAIYPSGFSNSSTWKGSWKNYNKINYTANKSTKLEFTKAIITKHRNRLSHKFYTLCEKYPNTDFLLVRIF